tara:strand:+ start:2213 stop:2338 length:126 start_codon:yes stop_codon:yes gene_type:complete
MYKKICRIVAMQCALTRDGRKDFEDAERIYRWLTEYFEKAH